MSRPNDWPPHSATPCRCTVASMLPRGDHSTKASARGDTGGTQARQAGEPGTMGRRAGPQPSTHLGEAAKTAGRGGGAQQAAWPGRTTRTRCSMLGGSGCVHAHPSQRAVHPGPTHPSRMSACTRSPPAAWARRSSRPRSRRRTARQTGRGRACQTASPGGEEGGAGGSEGGGSVGNSQKVKLPHCSVIQKLQLPRALRVLPAHQQYQQSDLTSRFSPGVYCRSSGSAYSSGTCSINGAGGSSLHMRRCCQAPARQARLCCIAAGRIGQGPALNRNPPCQALGAHPPWRGGRIRRTAWLQTCGPCPAGSRSGRHGGGVEEGGGGWVEGNETHGLCACVRGILRWLGDATGCQKRLGEAVDAAWNRARGAACALLERALALPAAHARSARGWWSVQRACCDGIAAAAGWPHLRGLGLLNALVLHKGVALAHFAGLILRDSKYDNAS